MELEKNVIIRYLDTKGIKHSNSGYQYLIESILNAGSQQSGKLKISDIYEKVAAEHDVTTSKVEKSINYLIAGFPESSKEFIIKAIDEIRQGKV